MYHNLYMLLSHVICVVHYMYHNLYMLHKLYHTLNTLALNLYRSLLLQGGEDPQDALSCRSFLAKASPIIGLFCGKWPTHTRHPMSLRHPVYLALSLTLSLALFLVRTLFVFFSLSLFHTHTLCLSLSLAVFAIDVYVYCQGAINQWQLLLINGHC